MKSWVIMVSFVAASGTAAASNPRGVAPVAKTRQVSKPRIRVQLGFGIERVAELDADFGKHLDLTERTFLQRRFWGKTSDIVRHMFHPKELPGKLTIVRFKTDAEGRIDGRIVEAIEQDSQKVSAGNFTDQVVRFLGRAQLVLPDERPELIDSVLSHDGDAEDLLITEHGPFQVTAASENSTLLIALTRRIAPGTEFQSVRGHFAPKFIISNEMEPEEPALETASAPNDFHTDVE